MDNTQHLKAGDAQHYEQACALLHDLERVSVPMLQRKLKIGYFKASRILAQLMADGAVKKDAVNDGNSDVTN
jgi:DNA segregation ATPase FtsK/SpoIIIE-like protein